MSSIYVYAWWSGLCIEWAENKINKIDGDTIYFYNDYCQEHQTANIKDCKPEFIKMVTISARRLRNG